DLRVADIRDRPRADDALGRPLPAEIRVELREFLPLAGLLRHPRGLAFLDLAAFEPREAAPVVREAVAVPMELAVAHDVDARLGLLAQHVDEGVVQQRLDLLRIDLAAVPHVADDRAQLRGPFEAAGMGGQNPFRASLHGPWASVAPGSFKAPGKRARCTKKLDRKGHAAVTAIFLIRGRG